VALGQKLAQVHQPVVVGIDLLGQGYLARPRQPGAVSLDVDDHRVELLRVLDESDQLVDALGERQEHEGDVDGARLKGGQVDLEGSDGRDGDLVLAMSRGLDEQPGNSCRILDRKVPLGVDAQHLGHLSPLAIHQHPRPLDGRTGVLMAHMSFQASPR